MVKVELSYNPYLLETKIKFNGQEPRINSLVEKYQKEILQNWVKKIPTIFYDEMNGYDFELEFSGTRLEYEDLENALTDAGVTNDMVRLFHKNELDCRLSKAEQIDGLLKWIEENPNRKFDFTVFKEENEELINSDYVCLLLNGPLGSHDLTVEYNVSIENIESVMELENTSLLHTPIIFWICNGIFNHTSLCQFYHGRLLLHVTIPFEEKPTSNLPGDNLRYYRQRKSLTTRQLAEQIDVVPATILMYEQNKRPIPFDVANGLAAVLDVNADILYDDFAVFLAAPYSEAFKDIRMSVGMSQRAFAEHIGVIPSYYYKLESGHRRPSRKVYQRMVDTLSHTHPHHSLFAQHKLQSK